MLLSSSWTVDFGILLLSGIVLLYSYISSKQKYWKKRGVLTPKIQPIFGHFIDIVLGRTTIAELLKRYYDEMDARFFGIYVFGDPYLIIKDATLAKTVLIKDFDNFEDRNIAAPEHSRISQSLLFMQKNPVWRENRTKLTAVFSSGKLKRMLPIFLRSHENLSKYLQENRKVMEAKELAAKFATDVISSCAFAIDSKCFDEKPSDFRKNGRRIFDSNLRNAFVQYVYFFKPKWAATLKLDFLEKDVENYFCEAFLESMKSRKDTASFNDLIDVLNDLKSKKEFSSNAEDTACALAITFFLGGYETASTTISFTLYELAKQPKLQDRLRCEIQSMIQNYGDLTYEAINDMKYLDKCIQETLRMYPVLSFLDRRCKTDYRIENSDVIIEKDTPVLIPLYGYHRDGKYFPRPHTFDPDRFAVKTSGSERAYFLPFGAGPRSCIGGRFGKLTTKVGIISFLLNSRFTTCEATPDPLVFSTKSTLLQSTVGMPLMFNPLD